LIFIPAVDWLWLVLSPPALTWVLIFMVLSLSWGNCVNFDLSTFSSPDDR
jgi:hypothetical protein